MIYLYLLKHVSEMGLRGRGVVGGYTYLKHVSEMCLRGRGVVGGLFFMLNGPNQLLGHIIMEK